jgi:hypothetical protein
LILALLLPLSSCLTNPTQKAPLGSPKTEISRERAIEVGRTHVKFQPQSITAEKTTENGSPVWRVTFRGKPVSQVHPMGEILIVILDRNTGDVVSIAKS